MLRNSHLASMTIFDTSSIEARVTENNPKYANRIIKQLKAFAKTNNFHKNYAPYKVAYDSIPTHAAAPRAIQQMYVNGHFCYNYKFDIVTNGLGIVRDITFYNKNFLNAHPDIVVEKKSDSPDGDKYPLVNPKTFPGNAAFDTFEIYKSLFGKIRLKKAFIVFH